MKKQLLIPLTAKKLWLLLFICGFTTIANAQHIAESFEGSQFPPQGWKSRQLYNYWISSFPIWEHNTSTGSHGSKSASIRARGGLQSYNAPGGLLVTSSFELSANQTVELIFDYNTLIASEKAELQVGWGNTNPEDNYVLTEEIVANTIDLIPLKSPVNSFVNRKITFTAPTSGSYYFGFILNAAFLSRPDSFAGVAIDKIIVQDKSVCNIPTAIQVSGVTDTTADVSWALGANANGVEVQVTEGDLPKSDRWISATGGQYSLASLKSGTLHTVYLRSKCTSGGYSDITNGVTFTTTCPETIVAPYTTTFITENVIAGCWSQSGDTNWKFNQYADYAASAAQDHTMFQESQYAWVDGTENTRGKKAILLSPKVNVSNLTNPALEFYVYSGNINGSIFNTFSVEVFNGSTWSTVATLNTSSNGWKFYSIDLKDHGSNIVQARFTVTGNTTSDETYYNDILLDDVSFKEKTACTPISNFVVEYATDKTASLSWSSDASVTSWDIAYLLSGEDFTGIPFESSITKPYLLQGLSSATAYDIYIRSNCGTSNDATWTGPYTIVTDCSIIIPPHIELFDEPRGQGSFNRPSLPICWQVAGGGTIETGPIDYSAGDWIANETAQSILDFITSYTASIQLYGANSPSWFLSPLFDLSAEDYEIKVDVAISASMGPTNTSMGKDDVIHLLYTENDKDWKSIKTWSGLGKGIYTAIIPLTDITGTNVRFAIWVDEKEDDDVMYLLHIDNFEVRALNSCVEPLNLSAISITNNSAKLTWDSADNHTAWRVALVSKGATPTDTDWKVAPNKPYLVENLLENATYDYYVKSICGGLTSDIIVGPYTFTTRCAPINAPYTETFEEQYSKPDCWIENPETYPFLFSAVYTWIFYVEATMEASEAGDRTPAGDTQYAWLNTATITTGEKAFLTTPLVDISALQNPALQFYLFNKNTLTSVRNNVIVEIYYQDNWIELTTINTPNRDWTEYTIDLAEYKNQSVIEVRFTVEGGKGNPSYNQIIIDDVSFMEMPACPAPYAIKVDNITGTEAKVSWTNSGSVTEWQIEYGLKGFIIGEGTTRTINTTPEITLQSLEPGKSYDVYVKAVCTEATDWTGPLNFTTESGLGQEDLASSKIIFYPNPVTDILYLKSGSVTDFIELYNVYGQRVKKQLVNSDAASIDFSHLSSGIYIMTVQSGIETSTYKIVKK